MEKKKFSKKVVVIPVIILACLVFVVFPILILFISGINWVPFEYRNESVSFLTPDLSWGDRPSDIIMKYGLPNEVGEVSDITGERDYDFSFTYDEKDVTLYVANRYLLNAVPHRYTFVIDCKTTENASAYFDECHTKIMNFHKDDTDFQFTGTNIETDYKYTNGAPCSYFSEYEDGVEKIYIVDDDLNEIPLEEAKNVVKTGIKENNYDACATTGTLYSLVYYEGESTVTLRANIVY